MGQCLFSGFQDTSACVTAVRDALLEALASLASAGVGKLLRTGAKAVKHAGRGWRLAERLWGQLQQLHPGTAVATADGTRKPIEDVHAGDRVLATDPQTGRTHARTVVATVTSTGPKHLVEVTVDPDGPKGERAGTVTATEGHPFWVQDRRAWVAAKDLRPGDLLRTSAGTYVQVTTVRAWASPHQRAHNLTIDSPHTYYVLAGDQAVLTHNCGGEVPGHPPTCKCGSVKPSSGGINWEDDAVSPGEGWEWRGPGAPGTGKGAWFKPDTRETLHPDLNHPDPIGPHWDYRAPDGTFYRIYLDGSVVPK